MKDQDTFWAVIKSGIAWIGVLLGSLTTAKVAILLTIFYTVLQIYVLVRDKIIKHEALTNTDDL
ncbi:MAG: hypothetical protein KGI54_15950 [Pseudomonadota bacterium]|nr:hypothetical protein [Pseudomonadota bacterium]